MYSSSEQGYTELEIEGVQTNLPFRDSTSQSIGSNCLLMQISI